MAKYRKLPVEIKAVLLEANQESAVEVRSSWGPEIVQGPFEDGWYIETLEGTMHAAWGDYLIQGVKGELYPCKPDIFEATYEKVV
jgi:hypothetical protein